MTAQVIQEIKIANHYKIITSLKEVQVPLHFFPSYNPKDHRISKSKSTLDYGIRGAETRGIELAWSIFTPWYLIKEAR